MHKPGLVFFAAAAIAATAGNSVEERIRRIQTSLSRQIVLAGSPDRFTISERLAHHKVPAVSAAVISNGRIEWARAWGTACPEQGRAANTETLFQAASISKPVASMVAMKLVEQGRLALDEDVNVKLRSWKVPASDFTAAEKVTLRRLMSHTAGLTVHGFRGYASGEPVPTLVQLLDGTGGANSAAIRTDIAPGSKFRYSGGGYEVMQLLIEDVTGKPFATVARQLVLEPLGMKHSTFEQPLPQRLRANAAHAYRYGGKPIAGAWHAYPEQAAAGLWTTPSDLARVILEIQKPGRVLKRTSVETMLKPVLGDYALGFGIGPKTGSFGHGGGNEGYRCFLLGYRDGRGVVVMTNGDAGSALYAEVLAAIAAEYDLPDYRPQQKTAVKVPDSVLASYAGQYQIPDGPLVRMVAEGHRIYAEEPGGRRIELHPESETSFFALEQGVPPFRFEKDADGNFALADGRTVAKRVR